MALPPDFDAAAHRQGEDDAMVERLAGTQSAAMGADVSQRYAQMGARWLSDPVPTRLDNQLIDRLSRLGFRRETLADVRIHRGTRAQDAASALGARAFAVGDRDVFFGSGEFDPHSRSGQAVLAHELAHVAPPAAGSGSGGVGMFGPVVHEHKRGEEDAAHAEAHERTARDVERRVYAMDDDAAAGPAMPGLRGSAAPAQGQTAAAEPPDPAVLEAKVMQILQKWERAEAERSGRLRR